MSLKNENLKLKKCYWHHLQKQLKHLYISPLEQCNLNCQICYTQKTKQILSQEEILNFIKRYQQIQSLESITFCGGEVFLLDYLIDLVNQLTSTGLLIQIITNGTIMDRSVKNFIHPNAINLIVSVDGLEAYHDLNRGQGNFQKSLTFLKNAQQLGFHTEIFSIVTQENYSQINAFEKFLTKELLDSPVITYHPRKSRAYLALHPIHHRLGQEQGFRFLSSAQINNLAKKKQIFPPAQLGCWQISLMSDKKIYACCEGIKPLGAIDDDLKNIIKCLTERLILWQTRHPQSNDLACMEADFVCGSNDV